MFERMKKVLGLKPDTQTPKSAEKERVRDFVSLHNELGAILLGDRGRGWQGELPAIERELAHVDEAQPRLNMRREELRTKGTLTEHERITELPGVTNNLLKLSERRKIAEEAKRTTLAHLKNICESLLTVSPYTGEEAKVWLNEIV